MQLIHIYCEDYRFDYRWGSRRLMRINRQRLYWNRLQPTNEIYCVHIIITRRKSENCISCEISCTTLEPCETYSPFMPFGCCSSLNRRLTIRDDPLRVLYHDTAFAAIQSSVDV